MTSCVLVIGVSLSEPHTSRTALWKCVCIYVCFRPYTVNFKCAFKYFRKIEHPHALSQTALINASDSAYDFSMKLIVYSCVAVCSGSPPTMLWLAGSCCQISLQLVTLFFCCCFFTHTHLHISAPWQKWCQCTLSPKPFLSPGVDVGTSSE